MIVVRVVNNMDAVGQIPVANSGWYHFGTELWLRPNEEEKICSREVYEDINCQLSVHSHSFTDHVKYWDVHILTCPTENPGFLFAQFIL
jgi:hypothetical protein